MANQHLGGKNPFAAAGSVAIYDAKKETEIGRFTFSHSYFGTTNFPLAICALHDGSKVYLASERDGAVYVLDTVDPSKPTVAAKIPTGEHPSGMLMDRAKDRLFVANADSDTVSVVDTKTDRVTSTLLVRPTIARELPGCTPTAVAPANDEKRLFVTLADINAVAVIDLAAGQLVGFIPTGWYPTALAVTPDGAHLLVANAKGVKARVPNVGRDPKTGQPARKSSPLDLLEGDVQLLPIPDQAELEKLSEQVLANNRLDALDARTAKSAGETWPGRRQNYARHLCHQRESHLRPGPRRFATGQRRSDPLHLWPRGDAQSPRDRRAICAARQSLRVR